MINIDRLLIQKETVELVQQHKTQRDSKSSSRRQQTPLKDVLMNTLCFLFPMTWAALQEINLTLTQQSYSMVH